MGSDTGKVKITVDRRYQKSPEPGELGHKSPEESRVPTFRRSGPDFGEKDAESDRPSQGPPDQKPGDHSHPADTVQKRIPVQAHPELNRQKFDSEKQNQTGVEKSIVFQVEDSMIKAGEGERASCPQAPRMSSPRVVRRVAVTPFARRISWNRLTLSGSGRR